MRLGEKNIFIRIITDKGLFVFLLMIMLCHCRNSESPPDNLPYCKMHTKDQSFVNNDKSDMVKYQEDREKRLVLIEENFDLLMSYANAKGFPHVDINMATEDPDSCKYWAVTMTMLHTAQTRPELFFSEQMAEFFSEEILKGNIERDLLKKCIVLTKMTTSVSGEVEQKMIRASKSWNVKY